MENTIDITVVLEIIISIVFILASKYIIPWLNAKKQDQNLKNILQIVEQVVKAANELGITGEIEDKAAYAWDEAIKILNKKGIKFNEDELKMFIKAAVTNLRVEIEDTDAKDWSDGEVQHQ